MTRYVSLDPGGTTGVAAYDPMLPKDEQLVRFQIEDGDHHLELWRYLNRAQPDIVICEAFNWRPNLTQHHVVLVSKEYIGICKLWCRMYGKHYEEQLPSYGKAFWDDDKLKRADMYISGLPHAMDATRHLLQYLCFKEGDQQWVMRLKD